MISKCSPHIDAYYIRYVASAYQKKERFLNRSRQIRDVVTTTCSEHIHGWQPQPFVRLP